MSNTHLSSQFDTELNVLTTKMLEMGGLVESQLSQAIQALSRFDLSIVERVLEDEHRLNAMEIAIDEEVSNIIVRRQPAARDLRRLMAISKTITNLERAGDEARKIAKRSRRIDEDSAARTINIDEIKLSGQLASNLLRRALDAFARLDTVAAAQIVHDDHLIDEQFRAFARKLASYMMEDPRTISVGLDYLFAAKAIERIGDHATNIAEFIVYVVDGRDVRHASGKHLWEASGKKD